MLECLVLLIGGTTLLVSVGLKALDASVDGAEEGIQNFGRNVEERTRVACHAEKEKEIRSTCDELNRTWQKGVADMKARHAEELDEAAKAGAQMGAQAVMRQLKGQ